MWVQSAKIIDQSQKNYEQQIGLKSTKGRHLAWYYRKGLKPEPYEQDGYAE